MPKRLISAGILAVLLALLAACETETEIARSIANLEPDFRLTAAELAGEFASNETSAEEKYEGRVIVVTGVIKEIYRGFLHTAYVDLEEGVRCNFSDNEDPVMLQLEEGQTVTMKGRGGKLFIGVEIRGCTVQ
ncbi:MAG: hypothetical protein O3A93_11625 [Chloroflexi bacterium]|nr:hypothetical protein [Chloroflexota bacterium]MDA1271888.1 hypothetical protein [Chloroflexota bacterium]